MRLPTRHERHVLAQTRTVLAAVLLTAGLAGCGGATSSGGTPAQPQVNPQAPPAPVTPTFQTPPATPGFESAEYSRSTGLSAIGASRAYQAGATGEGITVGVIDAGIDVDSAEFVGRIHPASADVVSSRSIDDPDGHGSYIAAIIAANRNGQSTQGIAYDSRILAARTDDVGSCASDCVHSDTFIAAGVDLAVNNGARVINISLGGSAPNMRLLNAIDRGTARGVIFVISAGNDEAAEPDTFASTIVNSSAARGLVLVAGAGTVAGELASFSNRAGAIASSYVVAPGVSIRVPGLNNGGDMLVSGTSFAAPHVAGALAVLLQAFPNLTPRQTVDLLLNAAQDLGASGTDVVFGRGYLNLYQAFRPQGQTSIATISGTSQTIALAGSNVQLGSAFGSAPKLGAALSGITYIDGYGRAFSGPLGATVAPAPARLGLARAIGLDRVRDERLPGAMVGLGFSALGSQPAANASPAGYREAPMFRDVRAQARLGLSGSTGLRLAKGHDGRALSRIGDSSAGYLTGDWMGLARELRSVNDTALGLDQQWGRWSFTAAVSQGERHGSLSDGLPIHTRQRQFHVRAALALEHAVAALGVSQLSETGSVLGAVSRDALGLGTGATTTLLSVDALHRLSDRLNLSVLGAVGRAQVAPAGRGLISSIAPVTLSAFQAELGYDGLLSATDRLGVRVMQPLRVENATASLVLPVDYDYATGRTTFTRRQASLAPSGREIAVETRYARSFQAATSDGRVLDGMWGLNLFHRLDPGHRTEVGADSGAVLELRLGF